MSKPNYCPNCGAELEGASAVMAVLDERAGDGVYDCYCGRCGWSGDVFPDDEQGA
jgi:hypothetical protein